MRVIEADNVNDALRQAVAIMRVGAGFVEVAPRDGKMTLEYSTPVTTTYERPWRRVLFSQVRDANPFFHLMESLWMLGGRDDVLWIEQFSSKIGQYAEDEGYFHGAYGARWRWHFQRDTADEAIDQLELLAKHIQEKPNSRRAVLAMWDPQADLDQEYRDIPCNTHVYFKQREGRLNMTVCCRSNDLVLGCYGANAVHFSILQEYTAAKIGVKMGTYTHVSDSWHVYVDNPFYQRVVVNREMLDQVDYYSIGGASNQIRSTSLVNGDVEAWDADLKVFLGDQWDEGLAYRDAFFWGCAVPMRQAWSAYKRGAYEAALGYITKVSAPDWRLAGHEWLIRRKRRKDRGEADAAVAD